MSSSTRWCDRIGVGWFRCRPCRQRLFAGFAEGRLKSPCFNCGRYVRAEIIVEGQSAHNKKQRTKQQHCCEICKGSGKCPIVAAAQAIAADGRHGYRRGERQKQRQDRERRERE